MRIEKIGNATLYLGDSRDVIDQVRSADALITDPPYGIGFKYASHDDRPESYDGGYGKWLWSILEKAERILTPGSPCFVWQATPNIPNFGSWFPRKWRLFIAAKNFVQMRGSAMQFSFDPVIVWWTPGAKPWSDGTANRDFHIANTAPTATSGRAIERQHPCPRPADQMRHVVSQWCRPDSIVLDPFMGSGTTGVACATQGRRFVGIEKDEAYFDIAVRRIEQANQQGTLLGQMHDSVEHDQHDLIDAIHQQGADHNG